MSFRGFRSGLSGALLGLLGLGWSAAASAQESEPPADGSSDEAEERVRYVLEGVEVRGNRTTSTTVILRYIPFKAGDVLVVDDERIELTRYRLLGTGFFQDVQFSLRKGERRGEVVLVVTVVERNTFIVNDVWMGVSEDADIDGRRQRLTAYAGIDAAETNLLGTGVTLGGAVGVAEGQLALRVRYLDPAFLGTGWMTSATLLFNQARDFFGTADVTVENQDAQDFQYTTAAVVPYKRFGGVVGVGHDLSLSTQLWVYYGLESVEASLPRAATERRGTTRAPIEFMILPGRSVLSTLKATLQVDERDTPFLPTRGTLFTAHAEVSLAPLGSDYAYERLDLGAAHWWKLPWGHVVSLYGFAGAMSGTPPFFETYYVGDLCDFLPSRVLGLTFDRRPPPNFFGTDIVEMRYGLYAAKIAGEYRVPIYHGSRSVYGIDVFAGVGVWGLASPDDLLNPPSGYTGLSRIPVDLTGNLGLRMDTSAGGFILNLSNVVGFIPIGGGGGT